MIQCDGFQLDAFQNDCVYLPTRRRRMVVVLPRIRVVTPEEERERELDMMAQALREDEELLLLD